MRQQYPAFVVAFALLLSACGGGGGGGSGSGSGSSSSSSSGSGGGVVPPGLTFTMPATLTQTADAGIGQNPIGEFVVQFSTEPTADNIPGFSFTDFGVNHVAFFPDNGSTTRYVGLVYFEDPSELGAGVYQDTVQVGICGDVNCTALRTGSVRSLQVTYTVTGTPQPPVSVSTTTTTINEEAQALTDAAPTFTVHLTYQNVRANNSLDITPTSTLNGLAGTSYERISESEGNVIVRFRNASTLPAGTYDDVVTINVCQGNRCPAHVAGSPVTINTRFVIRDTAAGPNGYRVRVVNQPALNMVWDEFSARLYLAVGSTAASHANAVVALDPATAALGASTSIGNSPLALAASHDGAYLYVGPRDSNVVQRLRLPSLEADLAIPLGGDGSGDFSARRLVVAPGASGTFAALRSRLPFGGGDNLAVFDGTVGRAGVLLYSDFGFGEAVTHFDWHGPGGILALGIGPTPLLSDVSSTAAGLAISNSQDIEPVGPAGDKYFDLQGGILYLSDGTVVDPSSGTVLGAFPVPQGMHSLVGIAADPAAGRVYALARGLFSFSLHSYDLASRESIAAIPLAGVPFSGNSPTKIVRWGTRGLALLATDGRIILIDGDFVRP